MDDNKRFWDRCAGFYTAIQQRSNRRLYRELCLMCLSRLQPDMEVLELACGSGQVTYSLCNRVKSWEATDFSEAMIREAEKNPCSAHFSCQDATCLPYENRSFDLVLMGNALHIMPEPEKALSEIRRVLKDGCLFLAPTFVYEGKVNRLRMKLTSLIGFKSYGEWTLEELVRFTESAGFELMEKALLPGSPLPEGFAALRKAP